MILLGELADQFIACGKSRDTAHELASKIWLAVLDNLEENEQTFILLKRLALEGDVSCHLETLFISYPLLRLTETIWKPIDSHSNICSACNRKFNAESGNP